MAFDFPQSPVTGTTVTGANGALYRYDGTKWVPVPVTGGATVTVSDAPPAFAAGSLWFDSVGTQLYLGYADPNSNQWIVANGQNAPPGPDPSNNAGRNFVHNGTFAVQQRGAGPWTANGSYTADRWKIFVSASTLSVSIATGNDTARNQIGDEAVAWLLGGAVTGTAGAGDYAIVQQLIENVRRLAGKSVTVSFWAAASSGSPKLGVSLDQNFGTGGSPSAVVNGNGQSVTLSSSTYARYSLTFSVPSISGKTLGTDGNDHTALTLWYSAGSIFNTRSGNVGVQTATIYLWGVQLEIGSVATPLAKRDPTDELALCQRFYQVGTMFGSGYQNAGQNFQLGSNLPVQMRVAPTVTLGSNGNINLPATLTATTGGTPYSIVIWGAAVVSGTCSVQQNYTLSADL